MSGRLALGATPEIGEFRSTRWAFLGCPLIPRMARLSAETMWEATDEAETLQTICVVAVVEKRPAPHVYVSQVCVSVWASLSVKSKGRRGVGSRDAVINHFNKGRLCPPRQRASRRERRRNLLSKHARRQLGEVKTLSGAPAAGCAATRFPAGGAWREGDLAQHGSGGIPLGGAVTWWLRRDMNRKEKKKKSERPFNQHHHQLSTIPQE